MLAKFEHNHGKAMDWTGNLFALIAGSVTIEQGPSHQQIAGEPTGCKVVEMQATHLVVANQVKKSLAKRWLRDVEVDNMLVVSSTGKDAILGMHFLVWMPAKMIFSPLVVTIKNKSMLVRINIDVC